MVKINVSLNIESDDWINFLVQSKRIGESASSRIGRYIKRQLKKGNDYE